MALDKTDFDPTASGSKGGAAPKIPSYGTSDTFATIETDGYFDDLDDVLKSNDLLVVYSSAAADGGVRIYHITKTSGDIALTRRMDGGKVYLPWDIPATELAAGTSVEVVCPVGGRISLNRTIIQTAIVTGGVITVEIAGVAVDGLSHTIADSATKGTVGSDAPTALHATAVVEAGDRIEIIPASEFTGGGAVSGILEIEVGS